MNDIQAKQVEMHCDFFDRCRLAIDSRFYLEAIFLEYSAIEGRLEAILSILGAPCHKHLSKEEASKINISHRIKCFKKIKKISEIFKSSKLPSDFFSKLLKWIDKRNSYIHGLYKSEIDYKGRLEGGKSMAEQGLEFARLLYNEAKRLSRLRKTKPELFDALNACKDACFE